MFQERHAGKTHMVIAVYLLWDACASTIGMGPYAQPLLAWGDNYGLNGQADGGAVFGQMRAVFTGELFDRRLKSVAG